jgi:hypothetical protein
MQEKPLGIYYLDYSDVPYPRSRRKMIIEYTRSGFLIQLEKRLIPDDWYCWLSECNTPGYLVEGRTPQVTDWIIKHMPDKFGDPLK